MSEQAFRTVVKATLDMLSAKGHEVPDDILPELYEAAVAENSVRVDFICPRCWGDLRIEFDRGAVSLSGSLLEATPQTVCTAKAPQEKQEEPHSDPDFLESMGVKPPSKETSSS